MGVGRKRGLETSYEAVKTLQVRNHENTKLGHSRQGEKGESVGETFKK